jgi:uncharacterized YigZ family protein
MDDSLFSCRMNQYRTIENPAHAEYKDRGSRFIAYAEPVSDTESFKKILRKLKEEHPKAAHHCFAYRFGFTGDQFRSSDGGEPSGTAGKPILGQIDSRELTNVAVVVVRYFGGTLLGVPGLINAYKTTTSLVLQLTPIIEKPVLEIYQLEFDYTLVNPVMMVIKKFGCVIIHQEMQLFCRMKVGIPKADVNVCLSKFEEVHGVTVNQI